MRVFRLRAAAAAALAIAVVPIAYAKKPVPASPPRAVATFESIGLYWSPGSNAGSVGCKVQYRKLGDTAWRPALDMWYDSRNGECRGSVVRLTAATTYEFQLNVGTRAPVTLSATTYQLAPTSPGYGTAVPLANFNDDSRVLGSQNRRDSPTFSRRRRKATRDNPDGAR